MPITVETSSDLQITLQTPTAMSSIYWLMEIIELASLLGEISMLVKSFYMITAAPFSPTGTTSEANDPTRALHFKQSEFYFNRASVRESAIVVVANIDKSQLWLVCNLDWVV